MDYHWPMASNSLKSLLLILFLAQPVLAQESAPLFSGVALNTDQQISLSDYLGKVET